MTLIRKITGVIKSQPTIEGAGVHLKRAFGNTKPDMLDPFLLMDDFHSATPNDYIKGFPWHPHRGIETITYMLEGTAEHGDSLGHNGVIHPGDVQWMTAGNGIIHQEMPKGDSNGRMWGMQLWANLPAKYKMMPPRYRDIKKADIPIVNTDSGIEIKIICGTVNGVSGPVTEIVIDPEYLDVTMPAQTVFNHNIKPGHTTFAYLIDGKALFDAEHDVTVCKERHEMYSPVDTDCQIHAEHLVIYGDGESVQITTTESSVRFLLISGKPIKEPIAWYGPIVMNTQAELKTAFNELNNGTFIKHTV